MHTKIRPRRVAVLVALAWCGRAWAVEPADALNHHMVLQRDKAVPIWGTARPGEEVTVTFAGQTKSAKADTLGKWLLRLEPMKASTEKEPENDRLSDRPEYPVALAQETYHLAPTEVQCGAPGNCAAGRGTLWRNRIIHRVVFLRPKRTGAPSCQ